jgi:undecaprenyl-phosphate 4-deoxy-4-formamido-L-arabinose transferase
VVYARYKEKRDSLFRNLGSFFNDKVANIMLGKPKDLYLSSFKAMNSLIRQKVIEYNGPFPYVDGIILTSTRNVTSVEVEHKERREGKSNYTFRKLFSLWSNMFTNFSIFPLRVATYTGLLFSFIGFLLGIIVIVEKVFFNAVPKGYAWIAVSIVIFAGIQLFALGMIGEYVGRLFLSHNRLPQFVIRERYGFGE